jgi:hypothetical protein
MKIPKENLRCIALGTTVFTLDCHKFYILEGEERIRERQGRGRGWGGWKTGKRVGLFNVCTFEEDIFVD